MRLSSMILVRRLLVFVGFVMLGVTGMVTDHPLVLFSGFPLILIVFTDCCTKCGHLWPWRDDKAESYFNPFYIPRTCPNCGHEM